VIFQLQLAVFCSVSIECFPGISSKFFLKLLITIPVAPIITGVYYYYCYYYNSSLHGWQKETARSVACNSLRKTWSWRRMKRGAAVCSICCVYHRKGLRLAIRGEDDIDSRSIRFVQHNTEAQPDSESLFFFKFRPRDKSKN
jgi:hypothetical protein